MLAIKLGEILELGELIAFSHVLIPVAWLCA